jgi:hypothetical protein
VTNLTDKYIQLTFPYQYSIAGQEMEPTALTIDLLITPIEKIEGKFHKTPPK